LVGWIERFHGWLEDSQDASEIPKHGTTETLRSTEGTEIGGSFQCFKLSFIFFSGSLVISAIV
jgi:hypothetical protein